MEAWGFYATWNYPKVTHECQFTVVRDQEKSTGFPEFGNVVVLDPNNRPYLTQDQPRPNIYHYYDPETAQEYAHK